MNQTQTQKINPITYDIYDFIAITNKLKNTFKVRMDFTRNEIIVTITPIAPTDYKIIKEKGKTYLTLYTPPNSEIPFIELKAEEREIKVLAKKPRVTITTQEGTLIAGITTRIIISIVETDIKMVLED